MPRQAIFVFFALALSAGASFADEDKKPSKKENTLTGVIKKVDPSAHMLIVTVSIKKVPADREIKLADTTRFVFQSGKGNTVMVGKTAYKNERLKERARVSIVLDGEGKAAEVRVSAPKDEK